MFDPTHRFRQDDDGVAIEFGIGPIIAGNRRHVVPLTGELHDVGESGECWCGPALYRVCDACGRDDDGSCWKCGGENVTAIQHPEPGDTVLIVHNRP